MNLWSTITEHAHMASGNFQAMFKDVEIPPLPAVVSSLLQEINRPEPDVEHLANVVASDPEIAAKVLRTVNSSQFALNSQIVSIQHAISLLGLTQIKSLVLAYTMYKGLPKPEGRLFNHQVFWTDSLLRAMLVRELASRTNHGDEDHAFTAMLLSDMALPVLLTYWSRFYEPVVYAWSCQPDRLSTCEENDFGWNHAEAGSWILNSWGFPDDLVYMVGAHNLDSRRIHELELQDTIALLLSIASLLPSISKPEDKRLEQLWSRAQDELAIQPSDWPDICATVKRRFQATCIQFGLSSQLAENALKALANGPGCSGGAQ